jgi:hypothetical protein
LYAADGSLLASTSIGANGYFSFPSGEPHPPLFFAPDVPWQPCRCRASPAIVWLVLKLVN